MPYRNYYLALLSLFVLTVLEMLCQVYWLRTYDRGVISIRVYAAGSGYWYYTAMESEPACSAEQKNIRPDLGDSGAGIWIFYDPDYRHV